MLELVLGVSGTGKTRCVLAEMRRRAEEGEKSILLVPEQFSSSAETMAYTALGDAAGAFCEVYSFTSLGERLLKEFGGTAVRTVTDAARAVAVRRAMDALGDELQLYRAHRRSTGFCAMAADAIQELKTAGAKPGDLLALAKGGDGREKLRELGLIFASYEDVLSGSAMDPSDRLELAARRADDGYFAGTAVFIDNFDGFTAPQYALLRRLVHAQRCVVTLCCDSLSDREDGLGLFSPVRQTAQRLLRLAQSEGVRAAAPRTLEKDWRHADAPGPALAARALAFPHDVQPAPGLPGVWLTPAEGVYAECKQAACRIAALVREGYAYGDIAVICRLLDDYAAPLAYEFGLAGIPYFTDEPGTPEHTAPASFLLAALDILVRGVSSEGLLRLLKTDLCGFTPQQIAALEDYAYTWNLRAADWRAPFTKHPAGFGANWSEADRARLAELEALRLRAVEPVLRFVQDAKGRTAGGVSRALYMLMTAFGADERTLAAAGDWDAAGDVLRAGGAVRAWNSMMDLLGQMEQLLGKDEIAPREYAELFALLIRSTDVGQVPQTQDAVLLTTADRMRLSGPKVCFVLGLSEGLFPKIAGASGLLTHADRDLLVQSGIPMPGGYENRTLLEQMYFYRALVAPSQRLYLSFAEKGAGGAPMTSALEGLVRALAPGADALRDAQRAPTPAAALDVYGAHYRDNTPVSAALRKALEDSGEAGEALAAMDAAAAPAPFKARNKRALEALLGRTLTLSPTRVEQYYRCHFAYFLQYVLRLRPRKKAQLSPLESGTLVHYILEHALREAGPGFASLTRDELAALAGRLADEYVRANMPDASARFAYLIERLKRAVTSLLRYLQAEQAQSGFHPVAYEQAIGGEGGLTPLTVTTPDGRAVRIVGQIDRVDVMRREGHDYVRVVDYKTGAKTFSLDDVYCGLNTQMLWYLFTLCENRDGRLREPVAAGVLYLAGDPPPAAAAPRAGVSDAPAYRVDGLVLDDPVVLRGMDRDATGLFVPCTFDKNGNARAGQKLAGLAKLGNIQKHITQLVVEMAQGLYEGDIAAAPLKSGAHSLCASCDYRCVCRHEDGENERAVRAPKRVFEPTDAQKDRVQKGGDAP